MIHQSDRMLKYNISDKSNFCRIQPGAKNVSYKIQFGDESNFFFNLRGGTLGTAATTGLLYQPRMIADGDCGESGGMKIGRGNRSTRRKPAPGSLYPPQIPHE
jgi:hypothetical protein